MGLVLIYPLGRGSSLAISIQTWVCSTMRGVAVEPTWVQVVRKLSAEYRVIFASRGQWKETRRQDALTRKLPPHPIASHLVAS
jgi:hypothetical protein